MSRHSKLRQHITEIRIVLQLCEYFKINQRSTSYICEPPYTLSCKLNDFIVWRHIWRKNWVNCAVFTGNNACLRTDLSSHLSHRKLSSSHRESQFPHFTCRHHDGIIRFYQSIQQMNITRYIPFQIPLLTPHFTLSFRITLWPMWLANSKRQPWFYPPQSHAQEDTQNWQKNWQTWCETCAVPENIQFSFSCSFFTRLNCTVLLKLYGAL
jgi:hypothetical protein